MRRFTSTLILPGIAFAVTVLLLLITSTESPAAAPASVCFRNAVIERTNDLIEAQTDFYDASLALLEKERDDDGSSWDVRGIRFEAEMSAQFGAFKTEYRTLLKRFARDVQHAWDSYGIAAAKCDALPR